jgi:hypothetical protein
VEHGLESQLNAAAGKKGTDRGEEGVGPFAHERCEGRFDFLSAAGVEDLDLHPHCASGHVAEQRDELAPFQLIELHSGPCQPECKLPVHDHDRQRAAHGQQSGHGSQADEITRLGGETAGVGHEVG